MGRHRDSCGGLLAVAIPGCQSRLAMTRPGYPFVARQNLLHAPFFPCSEYCKGKVNTYPSRMGAKTRHCSQSWSLGLVSVAAQIINRSRFRAHDSLYPTSRQISQPLKTDSPPYPMKRRRSSPRKKFSFLFSIHRSVPFPQRPLSWSSPRLMSRSMST